jgi:hypothetical protein
MGEKNRLYSRIAAFAREAGDTLTSHPRAGPLLAGLLQAPAKFSFQILERRIDGGRACGEDEVHVVRDAGQELVKSLPQASPDGVALHGVANLLRDREAQPGGVQVVRKRVYGEQVAPVSDPLPVDPVELR